MCFSLMELRYSIVTLTSRHLSQLTVARFDIPNSIGKSLGILFMHHALIQKILIRDPRDPCKLLLF